MEEGKRREREERKGRVGEEWPFYDLLYRVLEVKGEGKGGEKREGKH